MDNVVDVEQALGMTSKLSSEPLVSVIITNYNYGSYVAQAIESALSLDWPNVEVLVIDDGSTDDSRAVIARYADRVTTILQENSGQLVGTNKAFALSRGDIVIMLDADDTLHPALLREVIAIWTPTTSKVQVQMQTIDAQGRPMGTFLPQYHIVPTPRQVRRWSATGAAYPTPPGSGNVYARWFLERIFPLQNVCGTAPDSYCVSTAPYFGDVHTVPKALVSYRIHGRNQGALSAVDARQFARQLTRAQQRRAYVQRVAAQTGMSLSARAINRSLTYLCWRVASLTTGPDTHPVPGDSRLRVLADVTAAFFMPQGFTFKARLTILLWAWAVCLTPRSMSHNLVMWRFAPGARPAGLRAMLAKFGVVRA
ncbi:MAG: glycosyltransferase family A protein [Steroidobacteraceae bacterium]